MSADASPSISDTIRELAPDNVIRFEVEIDAETIKAQRLAVFGDGWRPTRRAYWQGVLPWYAAMLLGLYASLLAERTFFACIIGVILVQMFRFHRASLNLQMLGALDGFKPYKVAVTISDIGMSDLDRGVESSFACSAMNRWVLCGGVLCIELNNGLWALIPEATMSPRVIELEMLAQLLSEKGVPGKSLEHKKRDGRCGNKTPALVT